MPRQNLGVRDIDAVHRDDDVALHEPRALGRAAVDNLGDDRSFGVVLVHA